MDSLLDAGGEGGVTSADRIAATRRHRRGVQELMARGAIEEKPARSSSPGSGSPRR